MCQNLDFINNIINIIILIISILIIMVSINNYYKKEEKNLSFVIKRTFLLMLIFLLLILMKILIDKEILDCKQNIDLQNKKNTCVYFQEDYQKYKYGDIKGANIKNYGCAPTSAAIVLCTMLNDNSYEPIRVTKDICDMNGCTNMGTNMNVLIKYLNSKGLKTVVNDMYYKIGNFNHEQAEKDIYNALKEEKIVILHILNHYFVINGLEKGKLKIIQVGDKEQSKGLYSYKELKEMVETIKTIKKEKSYIQGYIIVSR